GTGVAVTGLAAGAIAFAVPAAVSGSAAPAPGEPDTVQRPVLGGATPIDARVQLAPAQQPAAATSAPPSVAPTTRPPPPVAGGAPRGAAGTSPPLGHADGVRSVPQSRSPPRDERSQHPGRAELAGARRRRRGPWRGPHGR